MEDLARAEARAAGQKTSENNRSGVGPGAEHAEQHGDQQDYDTGPDFDETIFLTAILVASIVVAPLAFRLLEDVTEAVALACDYVRRLRVVPFTGRVHCAVLPPELQRQLEAQLQAELSTQKPPEEMSKEELAEAIQHKGLITFEPLPSDDPVSQRLQEVGQRVLAAAVKLSGGKPGDDGRLDVTFVAADKLVGKAVLGFVTADKQVVVDATLVRSCMEFDVWDLLANLLAHELGHLVADHPVDLELVKATLAADSKFADPIIALRARAHELLSYAPVTVNTFMRELEYEADRLGAAIAALAGYNPMGAERLYTVLGKIVQDVSVAQLEAHCKAEGGLKGVDFEQLNIDSTHPSSSQRVQALRRHMPAAKRIYEDVVAGRDPMSAPEFHPRACVTELGP
ncbi:hypothetical protein GPECTOR_10g874 [Gonium pectorale]|uniref:Peptidase M48 domain-containing protein n=1 Tax=Gonium pectorale TaxID=33097 RepID=A0A150GR30_GONPE|nr:hypothetical protein GPECTOR_10g874 [Gonium pectorale]|eukprot:KXZ52243.1 hypothetical protein GPECTOR_10g874 [Gonium pectorale]